MGETFGINANFDSRDDAGNGDPDRTSKLLRRYHQLLWSKPLPGGDPFDLVTTRRGCYLYHESRRGKFRLTSDTVVPTFRRWVAMRPIIDRISTAELDRFQVLNHSMAGAMIFPGDRRPGTLTLNSARGLNRRVADRFDLTLEAIRRHYDGGTSPLTRTLENYRDFFDLFEDFRGYVAHFLLQDLVDEQTPAVRVFTPFEDFGITPALPRSVDEYRVYRDNAEAFLRTRNARIDAWARTNLAANR